jgi:anaerobic selenocysteine-containing dehydrogenase
MASSVDNLKTTCGICSAGCGLVIHFTDGVPVRVTGDTESPLSRGRLCVKGRHALDLLHHPDRLKQPLKRVGGRGDGNWQAVSWDEAIGIVAAKFAAVKTESGASAVAFAKGSARGLPDGYLVRLSSAFGSPNFVRPGNICHAPTAFASQLTLGASTWPDYDADPVCAVVWGSNTLETNAPAHGYLEDALKRGTRLIVVDPRGTTLARQADIWLRPRPGTDLALALAMLNVVLAEGLYDTDFVARWTLGLDELKEHVRPLTPEWAEPITWVPAADIAGAARAYAAARPAVIETGNAIEHNINSFACARALAILRAVTGNLDVPGGEVIASPVTELAGVTSNLDRPDLIDPAIRRQKIGAASSQLPTYRHNFPHHLVRSILDGTPYRTRAAYFMACNPLLTYGNSAAARRALRELEFSVVCDLFLTPTAALADIVLPAASFLEYDSFSFNTRLPQVMAQRQVGRVGEALPDYDIIRRLAVALGLDEYFSEDEAQLLDELLAPSGVDFEELKVRRYLNTATVYQKYLEAGFKTRSGKVELYSEALREWGFDPLPVFHPVAQRLPLEPAPEKHPPLVLTNYKPAPFHHAWGRAIPSLRKLRPTPLTSLHPAAAAARGIKDGDSVFIETGYGRIRQTARLDDQLDPRVAVVDYGWWYPEKASLGQFFGWDESNVNLLTDDGAPYSPEIGSSNLRGIECLVYRAD